VGVIQSAATSSIEHHFPVDEAPLGWEGGNAAARLPMLSTWRDPRDAVIVTGKGHERSMCFGTTEYPWSDQKATRERLQDMGYGG